MKERMLQEAADFIAQFEGYDAEEYVCPAGAVTFGYGSLVKNHPDVKLPVSRQQARIYLLQDLEIIEKALSKLISAPLNKNQAIALMSLMYNVGIEAFERSTLRKYLNMGKYSKAADEFTRWDHVAGKVLVGLSKRRISERTLFVTSVLPPIEPTSNFDLLKEQLSFEGMIGHYKAMLYTNLFKIGRTETKHEWSDGLTKVEHYLSEIKKLIHQS